MSQTIRIMCPNLGCRRVLAVPEQARGKMVRCSNCRTSIRIPGGQAMPAGKGSGARSETPR